MCLKGGKMLYTVLGVSTILVVAYVRKTIKTTEEQERCLQKFRDME